MSAFFANRLTVMPISRAMPSLSSRDVTSAALVQSMAALILLATARLRIICGGSVLFFVQIPMGFEKDPDVLDESRTGRRDHLRTGAIGAAPHCANTSPSIETSRNVATLLQQRRPEKNAVLSQAKQRQTMSSTGGCRAPSVPVPY